MNDYAEVRIDLSPCSETITDTLAAFLADAGFETFLPDEKGLTAYIRSCDYSDDLRSVLDLMPWPGLTATWTVTQIEGRDWNHEWEKNYFKPIVVGDRCVIHSSFHKEVPKCDYDIVIDPKMAFGTGHHSTTSLILQRLLSMPLEGRSLIDMGTGTGILSILAAMRGATPVTGIEIDEPAWENAVLNCRLNGHEEISMILGDASSLADVPYQADLFLANINRNVITADMALYVAKMRPGALLILSGFYVADIPVVRTAAEKFGLTFVDFTEMNDWASVAFRK